MLRKTLAFYSHSLKHQLLIGAAISIWIWLFLFVTEPLDVRELSYNEKLQFLTGYALLLWVSYSLTIPVQRTIYKAKKTQWTLGFELLTLFLFSLVMFSLAYGFYRLVVVANEPNPYTPDFFFLHRFIPVFAAVVPVFWLVRWGSGLVTKMQYIQTKVEGPKTEQFIHLQGDNQREVLKIKPDELVYLEAANNYVKIHYLAAGELQNVLFRNKLSVYEQSHDFLVRIHRSYLINPTHFLRFKQENKKYKIVLNLQSIELPVSKNLLETVENRIVSPQ
ncbi:MAG TPA: hypothetical protein DCS93_05375 [Microscillaceae bacterium]|nr:hypothetical protein [Microscillaceae bacterium]